MTRRIITTAIAAALTTALAAPAGAKQIHGAQVCGASGCRDLSATVRSGPFLDFRGSGTSAPPQGSDLYRFQMQVGDEQGKVHDTFAVLVAPAARRAHVEDPEAEGRWYVLTPGS